MTPQTLTNKQYSAGPKSKALFLEEQTYIAPGLQTIALYAQLAIEGGTGATLRDVDGNEYLDLVAGIGVASLGYGHPDWAKAVGEQAAKTICNHLRADGASHCPIFRAIGGSDFPIGFFGIEFQIKFRRLKPGRFDHFPIKRRINAPAAGLEHNFLDGDNRVRST